MMRDDHHARVGYHVPPSAHQIDEVCDRFEADWRAGHRPQIEACIAGADGPQRELLLRELLLLEIELARKSGAAPTSLVYHARFPDDAALVDAAFGDAASLAANEPKASGSLGDLAPGLVIGRYVILAPLDEGGEALVYRVLHTELGKPFVLKLGRRPVAPAPVPRNLLAAQGRLLAELDHPRLVKVVDLDVYEGRPYLVMEYVPGLNLAQYAAQRRPTARRAAALVSELAEAAAYLHRRGIIHQDIKPKNILIDELGQPRLIDFGQARLRHAWSETQEASGGTLAYMAPEQADGQGDRITPRTDIFGLGAVLYELLTGRPPYQAQNSTALVELARAGRVVPPRRIDPRVPRKLEAISLRAMAREPEDRHAGAAELERELRRYLRRPAIAGTLCVFFVSSILLVGVWARSAQYSLRTGRDSPLNAEITPRGTNGARAAPEPDPANSRAVAISLAVKHFRGDDSSDLGIVGRASHLDPVVVDDDIRLNVQLDPPARSYLLALNADGSVQLLDPAASSVPPDISARVDYPRDPRSVFGLTEGAGTQAFVLVAARAGLPAYADWPTGRALREYCQEHWGRYGKGHSAEPDRADSIWEFAGGQIRALGPIARGTERQRRPSPTAFSGLCDLLRQAPGIDAIYVVAFPVRPRPAESPATRADESGQPSAPSNLVKESKQ